MPTNSLMRALKALAMVAFCGGMAAAGYALALPGVDETPLPPELAVAGIGPLPVVRIFDDFQCAACDRFDRQLGEQLVGLAREGRIRLQYYHAPLTAHTQSRFAAAAVACAPPELRPELRSRLHRDRQWVYDPDPVAAVLRVAAAAEPGVMTACMEADSTASTLRREAELGRRAGVQSVPTVWLNGSRVRFRSYASLLRHIERNL